MTFKDEFGSRSRAKPPGAARLELFVELVAEHEPLPSHPGELSGGRPWYLRSFTRSPIEVEFPVPASPMLVVYWARWADATGAVGPWSQTVQARVEGAIRAAALPAGREAKRIETRRFQLASRELPDPCLEQISAQRLLPSACGTYDLSRPLQAPRNTLKQTPLLGNDAAA